MLAALACAARPHGARRWDPPGVMAALANVRHLDLAEVTKATMNAAANGALATPGAIGNPSSEVWRTYANPTATTSGGFDRGDTCGVCGKSRHDCERNPHGEHEFEPLDSTYANARPRHLGDLGRQP